MSPRVTRLRTTAAAGAAIGLAGAGLLWRAHIQGVFATGQGPAYEAWRQWRGRPGDGVLALVRAAVLASNSHNSQPWRFVLGDDRIDLHLDPTRDLGALDPLQRERYLSAGCALENLVLAARAHGFAAAVDLLPSPDDATHVARVTLTARAAVPAVSADTVERVPLYEAIPRRHTNRAPHALDRPVADSLLEKLAAVNDVPDQLVHWITTDDTKQRFRALSDQASAALNADPDQVQANAPWFRHDWRWVQERKDGLTIDSGGLPDFMRIVGKLLLSVSVNPGLPVPDTAVFGLLLTRERADLARQLQAGRLWQRLHLAATVLGLAMQPIDQTVVRADREQAAGLEPTFTRALEPFLPEPRWQVMLPFRVGYSRRPALASPRRPADEVARPFLPSGNGGASMRDSPRPWVD